MPTKVPAEPLESLKVQIDELCTQHPGLDAPNAFLAWFGRAYLVDDEATAVATVRGGPHDKGIDAVFQDESLKHIYLIQGKYRSKRGQETRADVLDLARYSSLLAGEDGTEFRSFIDTVDGPLKNELLGIRKKVRQGWTLNLFFVTTGRVSSKLEAEAVERAASFEGAVFRCFDEDDIVRIVEDYIGGIAPAVPLLNLAIHGMEVFQRRDETLHIESWVFSMRSKDVGDLFDRAGRRLFARNIRGYLGDRAINKEIRSTLTDCPEYFWYYNNGVTIVCDSAKRTTEGSRDVLAVHNPQVINGQQSTRAMALSGNKEADVLVRVIAAERNSSHGQDKYHRLVNQIVKATNWQNPIKPADLRSNDDVQVWLERQLRKLDYQYLRKRETKGEARERVGNARMHQISINELAAYLAACMLDPAVAREGEQELFSERVYPRIFDQATSVWKYLAVYWIGEGIRQNSHGDEPRRRAKWVVLHFLWNQLAHQVGRNASARIFVETIQDRRSPELRDRLGTATDMAFQCALEFYRAERAAGDDEDLFFKRLKIAERMERFIKSSKCKRRERMRKAILSFEERLSEALSA